MFNFFCSKSKNVLKKQFFHHFFRPTFFCISRLFLWHPDCFLSVYKQSCSNSKTDEQTKLFLKNSTFSQKKSLDARIAVVTTREKIFFPTKRFMDQSPKKVWKIIYISKIVFPQKLPRIHRLRVSQLWQKFSLDVNIRTELEKRANFSLLKKIFINCSRGHLLLFCQPWTSFSNIVPKISKIFRKSSSFQDFHSENLLYKCSIGHVENIFDNPAKKISCKNTGFSCQNPKKKTKNQLFNSFFDVFTSVRLVYCFNTPD